MIAIVQSITQLPDPQLPDHPITQLPNSGFDVDGTAINWITDSVLAALGRGERVDAVALTFLLGRYCEIGRAHV